MDAFTQLPRPSRPLRRHSIDLAGIEFERPRDDRWPKPARLAVLFVAGFSAWWLVIAIVSAVAKARGL